MPALHPAVAAPLHDASTRRLRLHRLGLDDVAELTAIFTDPAVWWFDYERGLTAAETNAYLERQMRLWSEYGFGGCAVRDLGTGTLLGDVGLGVPPLQHPELPPIIIRWLFAPSAWRHGYATEAASALLDQAFGPMQVDAVGCITNALNERSIAVAQRLGMQRVGETTGPRPDGQLVDAVILRIEKQRWRPPPDERERHA
jgi:RimJ/RimL family protein N-acetyltransferase